MCQDKEAKRAGAGGPDRGGQGLGGRRRYLQPRGHCPHGIGAGGCRREHGAKGSVPGPVPALPGHPLGVFSHVSVPLWGEGVVFRDCLTQEKLFNSLFLYFQGKLPLSGIAVNRLEDIETAKNAFEITGESSLVCLDWYLLTVSVVRKILQKKNPRASRYLLLVIFMRF